MSTAATLAEQWRRAQHGWPARFPLVQAPNAPLLVALGGGLTAAVTDGSAHAYGRAVLYAGLSVWAWEEMTGGVNWARRLLGAAGAVYVVARVGSALGA